MTFQFATDRFLDRSFDANKYNCLHFTREVWLAMTGEDIQEKLGALLTLASAERRALAPKAMLFEEIVVPVDPCFAVMQRPRFAPHIGIYFNRAVLSLEEHGVQYLPLRIAMLGFNRVRYYK